MFLKPDDPESSTLKKKGFSDESRWRRGTHSVMVVSPNVRQVTRWNNWWSLWVVFWIKFGQKRYERSETLVVDVKKRNEIKKNSVFESDIPRERGFTPRTVLPKKVRRPTLMSLSSSRYPWRQRVNVCLPTTRGGRKTRGDQLGLES